MISLILYFTLQLQASGIAMDTGAILSDVGGAETMALNPINKPPRPTKPPKK